MPCSFWQRIYLGLSTHTMVMSLSEEEQRILSDTRFLRLKHHISEKIISYLADIERALHQEIGKTNLRFPEGTFLKAGKISKGEQYKGLPYFILDYPRLFTQNEVFAFRTMLWWGHHFSCTLHLSGPFLEKIKASLIQKLTVMDTAYFCVNNQPWEYHFEPDNYLPLGTLGREAVARQIDTNGFVKLSDFIPLNNWDGYKSFALETFARFLQYTY